MESARPHLLVLLGHPVSHSLSPHFQNAAIQAAGIEAVYQPRDVAPHDLAAVVDELRRLGAAGNVTVPHKQTMADLCEIVSPVAERASAVNTFWFEDDRLCGDNTDVGGFNEAIRRLLGREPDNERIVVLGAGGSAAAVLAAVEAWPLSRVAVVNRSADRARALCARFPNARYAGVDAEDALSDATLVVNATSVGLNTNDTPVPVESLVRGTAVLDLVYRAGKTALVRGAHELGLVAADGREMLLEQGALAFTQWFGCAPDRMVMRSALERAINKG
jgi:shikimate dehydrogenase